MAGNIQNNSGTCISIIKWQEDKIDHHGAIIRGNETNRFNVIFKINEVIDITMDRDSKENETPAKRFKINE